MGFFCEHPLHGAKTCTAFSAVAIPEEGFFMGGVLGGFELSMKNRFFVQHGLGLVAILLHVLLVVSAP